MTGGVSWHEDCPNCGRTWTIDDDPTPRQIICACGSLFEMPTNRARREEHVVDLKAYRTDSSPD
jgi:hypothetical protein